MKISALTKKELIDLVDFAWDERQGHCPNMMYEDGYSDACAEIKRRIIRVYEEIYSV